MYLKRLEMKGFKSFADKTEVEYENGVTCIVGPNGSGKSNITDAVRWVLGEQKVKTLRGSKMEDVIFNGTKHRKPLGMAEVSLVFDNRENFFPLDYNEVTVTRRVYRSGDSDYLVNGTSCRLKDVKELFMDTGIGTDGYSIIGQGRIDRILSNNADERRQIFEEAAGIVKYKARKEESQKKLNNTQANLLRVDDIIRELEGRVEPLRKESEKAQTYMEFTESLKSLEINLFIRQMDTCEQKIEKETNKTAEIKSNLNSMQSKLVNVEGEIETIELEMDKLNVSVKELESSFLKSTEDMGHLEAKASQIEEKQKHVVLNKGRIEGELSEVENSKQTQVAAISETQKTIETLTESLANLDETLKSVEGAYQEKARALTNQETDSESAKQKAIQILNGIEREKIEVSTRKTVIDNLSKRIENINDIIGQADETIEALKESQVEAERVYSDLEKCFNGASKQKNEEMEALKCAVEQQKSLEKNLQDMNHKIMKARSERQVLIDMEKAFEGYDYSVKGVLKACAKDPKLGQGMHGVVTNLMSIPKNLERAVEVALGRQLQNIVTETEQDTKRLIDYLKTHSMGRVTFLPLSNIRANRYNVPLEVERMDGFIGVADDLVEYEGKYRNLFTYLLGRTVIVKDYQTAVHCLKIKGMRHRIVTIEGEILTPGGAITGGSFKSRIANLLGRKRKIEELGTLVDQFSNSIQKMEADKKIGLNTIEAHQLEIQSLTENCDSLRMEMVKHESSVQNITKDLERSMQEMERMQNELQMIEKERCSSMETIEQKEKEIIKLEAENKSIEEAMRSYSTGIQELQERVRALSEQMTAQKVEKAGLNQKLEYQNIEFKRIEKALLSAENTVKIKKNELERLNDQQINLEKLMGNAQEDMRELRQSMLQIEQNKQDLSAKLQSCQTGLANKRLIHEKELADLEGLKETLHKQDIAIAKFEMEKENIISNLWEKYEVGFREALEYKTLLEDVKQAEIDVKSLKGKIRRLGEVNLNSIEEYKEVKERFEFLTTERDDLIKSQKALEKVIRDLEKMMIHQFNENFKIVREHFVEIFGKLFTGGQADLLLLDKEDVLSSGIEIVAQPPGKKLQSLSLLSGGERAMTAIALLFAILKTKPAPFCILDEIEAALDDVNVFRFADFLKEFTRNSQFVIITHRKGTMEIANTLYGVTMQEYGVSKIVSVKLEDVKL